MHHIFIKKECFNIESKLIIIDKDVDFENYNHLVNSLRIRMGEAVLCSLIPFISTFDYLAKVEKIDNKEVILVVDEEMIENELPIIVNLYQGMPKADKLEYIIEKSVELGVHSIIPIITKNCVAKLSDSDKKNKSKLERLNKISKAAAEQSIRHIVPEVMEPMAVDKIYDSIKNDINIVFYENAKTSIEETRKVIRTAVNPSSGQNINIFIGPEGGFTNDEINDMIKEKFYVLTLGSRILRTETAAITALSIFMYEFEKRKE